MLDARALSTSTVAQPAEKSHANNSDGLGSVPSGVRSSVAVGEQKSVRALLTKYRNLLVEQYGNDWERSPDEEQQVTEVETTLAALSTTTVAQPAESCNGCGYLVAIGKPCGRCGQAPPSISEQAQPRWPEGVRSSCCDAPTVYHADGFECTVCKKWCAGIERAPVSEQAQRAAQTLWHHGFLRGDSSTVTDKVAAIIQAELKKGEDEQNG